MEEKDFQRMEQRVLWRVQRDRLQVIMDELDAARENNADNEIGFALTGACQEVGIAIKKLEYLLR